MNFWNYPSYGAQMPEYINVGPTRQAPNPFARQPMPNFEPLAGALGKMGQMSPQSFFQAQATPILAQSKAQNRAIAGDVRRRGLGAGMAHQMAAERGANTAGLLGQAGATAQSHYANALAQQIQGYLGMLGIQAGLRGQDIDQSNTLLGIIG